jgi:hypothetical protein
MVLNSLAMPIRQRTKRTSGTLRARRSDGYQIAMPHCKRGQILALAPTGNGQSAAAHSRNLVNSGVAPPPRPLRTDDVQQHRIDCASIINWIGCVVAILSGTLGAASSK